MIAMDQTIAGAASGETAGLCGAEGFTISGKRTEEYGDYLLFYYKWINKYYLLFLRPLRDWRKFQSLFYWFTSCSLLHMIQKEK